jgi:hypothetical protein
VPGERRFRQLGLYTAYALVLPLKCPWADGTRHLLFEPLTLLEKLAALIPRPRTNLVVNPDPVAGEGAASASQLDESSHPNELDDMTCAEARRRVAVRQSVRQMAESSRRSTSSWGSTMPW